MTGRERRAAEAARLAARAESIALAYQFLGSNSSLTVAGGTLITPDGKMIYIGAEDARAFHGKSKPGGRA